MTFVKKYSWTIVLFVFIATQNSFAAFKSEVDDLLTVRTIAILPVFDNLQGIYARPVESFLIENFAKDHRFEYVRSNFAGPILTPDELEESPEKVASVSASLNADAFVATRITKGPRGIAIRMGLFLTKDSKLLVQEELSDFKRQDLESLKKESLELLSKLLRGLPYDGLVLSRQGTRVTLNLGKQDGVQKDQVLTVVQIIKTTRHPKFNFLVSTEKEILGRIKLLKVEDTLSFGRIITEKESDVVQVFSKLSGLGAVVYGDNDSLNNSDISEDSLKNRPEAPITFGDHPTEWLPTRRPTFGQIGASLGIGNYSEKAGSYQADAPFYPFIKIDGELWLTPIWSMHAGIRQGILTTENPVGGGSPSDLSHRVSSYEFLMGYNLRLGAAIDAPKVEFLGGFSTYDMYVDESTPAGLTSKTYSGVKLGVSGDYPLNDNSPYSLGANLFFFFNANLKEEPTSSGKSDNSITQFGLFLDRSLRINLKARFNLDFELYDSKFSGATPSTASQKLTSLSGGIYYLF